MPPRRVIPLRELRNSVSAVLRDVEAGEPVRVTVRGRAVADVVPVSPKRTHLSARDVERIRREAPLDRAFAADLDAAAGATIDEL
jgi:prevent-host-death family protein